MADKPYAVLDTKNDFEKWFKEIYHDGYEAGYKEGLVRALGHIYNTIDDHFDDEIKKSAEYEARHIGITNWQRRREYEEELKKSAVDEYIQKQKEETEDKG